MSAPEDGSQPVTFEAQHGPALTDEEAHRLWILEALKTEGKAAGRIAFIFVSDQALHAMNVRHLLHDDYTDILTFPYAYDPVEAEIFISVDRVRDNAQSLGVAPDDELRRVMIHGILHMCGYGDKTPDEQAAMRAREDTYLQRWGN